MLKARGLPMTTATRKPVPVRVDGKGCVMLPAHFRKALGLEPGDTLFAQQVGRTLRLAKAEDPLLLLWQHAEKEYAEGRTVTLEEFAAQEGLDLNAPQEG
ncbi:AbrB/MazE/SpoVT family DNA-binding domain-containing protein [Carboxydochorda subterranea]|uniref:AbrB/MazE/SpoVT family DNA-binding domain-containing protein n=1 Tax=Carboxydichorda subterranea TaxID=3109565 RepID=A0ABZ1BTA7_9FIRM|nr:AbrB/MazE/SpoVT family DNA-binding domain-containing protein [Limnochorda sp. L945t]WRP16014.1 AbrB/MazE/SpoVT family DNA-binding domain-containing protein [Limnochorda sp. L945t]